MTGGDPSNLRPGADTFIDNFIRALDVASGLGAIFPPLKAASDTLNVMLKNFKVRSSLMQLVTHLILRGRMYETIKRAFKA